MLLAVPMIPYHSCFSMINDNIYVLHMNKDSHRQYVNMINIVLVYLCLFMMHILEKSLKVNLFTVSAGSILSTTRKEVETFWNRQCLVSLWSVMQLRLCQTPIPSHAGFRKRICSAISSLVRQLLCIRQRNLSVLPSSALLVPPPNHKKHHPHEAMLLAWAKLQVFDLCSEITMEKARANVHMVPLHLCGWIWMSRFESVPSKSKIHPTSSCASQASCLSKLLHCSM